MIILLTAIFALTGCKEKQQSFGEPEQQAIRDTINMLMDDVRAGAEKLNAEETLSVLTDEPGAVFMTGGMNYSKADIISRFKKSYGSVKTLKLINLNPTVLVFSNNSAAWISVTKEHALTTEDIEVEQFLCETWIWQRETDGWRVAHYHESYLPLPDACRKATIENGLKDFANTLAGRDLNPTVMPPLLTNFLKLYPEVYGSVLAFAPAGENENNHVASPYIYRKGRELVRTELPASYNYSQSEWYSVPVQTRKPAWSNPYYDIGGGEVVMTTYSIPLFDRSNKLIGVLTADVALE